MTSLYDYPPHRARQRTKEQALADYRGKVLLIVNAATRCGLTPQYEELQQLCAQ